MTSPSASADDAAATGASRWTVAIFALLGLGVGLLFFALRSPSYEAEALVAVSNPVGPLADEIAVVTGPVVLNASQVALGFEPDISVTAAEVASLLTITATADEAQQAADAANTVAATYVQAQLGAAANVAQPATVPDGQSGLSPIAFAAIGSLLGALLGAIVSFFQAAGRKPESEPLAPTLPDRPDASTLPHDPFTEPIPELSDPRPPETPVMSERPSSFFDAATSAAPAPSQVPAPAPVSAETESPLFENAPLQTMNPVIEPVAEPEPVTESWIEPQATAPIWAPDDASVAHLEELDRRALLTQFESARYELVLSHNEDLARRDADHERQVAELRADVANLNKQLRMQEVRLKNRSGSDQNRVGDLEAQTDALESELAGIRQTLESERIAHAKRITEERGAADRALDNARRQYREELSKHVHTHRQALADHRADLDNELAADRAKHAASLEAQHHEYERQLETERSRLESKDGAALERHKLEVADLQAANRQELDQQAIQHKETIAELRAINDSSDLKLRDLEKENRALRVESSTQQKQARHNESESAALMQRLSDEISIMRGELEGERERNAALRADVLRRSAEAHQAIDQAVEERTAQLSELEASVARQREYADRRVQETSAAAEEQARQAAMREADLTATISRLKRDLAEAQNAADRL